jgi:hypothetical protein
MIIGDGMGSPAVTVESLSSAALARSVSTALVGFAGWPKIPSQRRLFSARVPVDLNIWHVIVNFWET